MAFSATPNRLRPSGDAIWHFKMDLTIRAQKFELSVIPKLIVGMSSNLLSRLLKLIYEIKIGCCCWKFKIHFIFKYEDGSLILYFS